MYLLLSRLKRNNQRELKLSETFETCCEILVIRLLVIKRFFISLANMAAIAYDSESVAELELQELEVSFFFIFICSEIMLLKKFPGIFCGSKRAQCLLIDL